MFTHFPGLSGACSASASIIGSEAVSPYPFHYVPLYVCVCVHFSQLVYFLFFFSSFAKKATYSVFRSPSKITFKCHSNRDLQNHMTFPGSQQLAALS